MNQLIFSKMIWIFLFSSGIVLLNEMGDKSQLMAIAFSARMKLKNVITGIILAVISLNLIAVVVGSLLAEIPGWNTYIGVISSALFLVFAVWTLAGDKHDTEKKNNSRNLGNETAIVFAAFVFSEMGDKTQLLTVSLAAQYPQNPVIIFAGATLGMMLADTIGIVVGIAFHRKLPENALKILSASLFLFFGVSGLYSSLLDKLHLSASCSLLISSLLGLVTVIIGYLVYINSKSSRGSPID